MSEPFTVALNISIQGGSQRRIVCGILRYCQLHTHWNFVEHQASPLIRPPYLERHACDGLITWLTDAADIHAAHVNGIPVVTITNAEPIPSVYTVTNDDTLIGELGARYFCDRGFRHFAFYGASHYRWASDRKDAFCRVVKQAGYSTVTATVPRYRNLDKVMAELTRWLEGLPRPVAVMASDDLLGRHILEACRKIGLQVPDQIAVLGVDNDEVICNMTTPPMSSIATDCDKIGYEAAALLDRMMCGQRPPIKMLRIPPLRVVSRRSTDIIAIEDREVAKILRLIRAKADQPLSVKMILRDIPMSRRTLERRFMEALGRSPADEIRRVHLERAMMMLRNSDMNMNQVAYKSGFCDARGMAIAFRRHLRISPTAYRRQFQDQ